MHNPSPATATELCNRGMSQFGRFRADAMLSIDAAINADSSYCLPVLIKAWMLQGANDARFHTEVKILIEKASQLLSRKNVFELGLLNSLTAAHGGNGMEAANELEQLVQIFPTNLFAHVLAQEQTFWLGEPGRMRTIVERAAPAWNESHEDYGPFLSLRSFANEESGFFEQAEKFGRAAVEIDSSDVWGAHSVAHVLFMKGEQRYGLDWLETLCGNWKHANQMRHHLWWHICLCLFETGDFDRIITLLDTEIRNPDSKLVQESPKATIDINNYASLLMRLELYGVDVSDLWQSLFSVCAERVSNHGSAFSNIHDMMVLTGSGNTKTGLALLESIKTTFEGHDQSSIGCAYRNVAIPVCEVILAHRARDFNEVISKLDGIRHQLQLIGASHAQRDVFYHMLVHAAEQEGRNDLRTVYLQDIERLGFCNVPQRAAYKNGIN